MTAVLFISRCGTDAVGCSCHVWKFLIQLALKKRLPLCEPGGCLAG